MCTSFRMSHNHEIAQFLTKNMDRGTDGAIDAMAATSFHSARLTGTASSESVLNVLFNRLIREFFQ